MRAPVADHEVWIEVCPRPTSNSVYIIEQQKMVQQAVADAAALVSRYGISAERLSAHGVGPLVPVASNDSDQGRALNRRVELVKR